MGGATEMAVEFGEWILVAVVAGCVAPAVSRGFESLWRWPNSVLVVDLTVLRIIEDLISIIHFSKLLLSQRFLCR
jgi:hypothetical protein